jgi:HEPN domain-containing protein
MADRTADWMAQAEQNPAHAEASQDLGHYNWACFAAQQAAEASVKALHLHHKQDIWGHLIRTLLQKLPDQVAVSPRLLDLARVLDAYYIPTRYPNGHESGTPAVNYGAIQSDEAIRCAREIIQFCRSQMAGS